MTCVMEVLTEIIVQVLMFVIIMPQFHHNFQMELASFNSKSFVQANKNCSQRE